MQLVQICVNKLHIERALLNTTTVGFIINNPHHPPSPQTRLIVPLGGCGFPENRQNEHSVLDYYECKSFLWCTLFGQRWALLITLRFRVSVLYPKFQSDIHHNPKGETVIVAAAKTLSTFRRSQCKYIHTYILLCLCACFQSEASASWRGNLA